MTMMCKTSKEVLTVPGTKTWSIEQWEDAAAEAFVSHDWGLPTLSRREKVEASHLCNSGPCCNPRHILLEISERNQIRKQHQHGRLPCDYEVLCLRNGLVWYVGEEKGVDTHLNLVYDIRQKELSNGALKNISLYNKDAREKQCLLVVVFCLLSITVVKSD